MKYFQIGIPENSWSQTLNRMATLCTHYSLAELSTSRVVGMLVVPLALQLPGL